MITNFQNLTNEGELPVDGDSVYVEINGVPTELVWSLSTLNSLLIVEEQAHNPITPLEFRRLFPPMAMLAIDGFESDTALTEYQKDVVRSYMKTFDTAESVDLLNEDVQGALSLFVSLGWLTDEEKDTITRNGVE